MSITPNRIHPLNDKAFNPKGKYILYWMQGSQRTEYNHALEYSIQLANEYKIPLIVYFEIMPDYPNANLRHFQFMLEGLLEVNRNLKKLGIKFVIYIIKVQDDARQESQNRGPLAGGFGAEERHEPLNIGYKYLSQSASFIISDFSYLRHLKSLKKTRANETNCPFILIESDVIVPVETVSSKEEYAAYTIRPKIHRLLKDYLIPFKSSKPVIPSLNINIPSLKLETESDISKILNSLNVDKSVPSSNVFKGGLSKAKRYLKQFLNYKLPNYSSNRNDPSKDFQSHMSPYLHFGQISPLYITLSVLSGALFKPPSRWTSLAPDQIDWSRISNDDNRKPFLEELIVRRELSMNFAHFNPDYDDYNCLPSWAKKTLEEHEKDKRQYIYSLDDFENAKTYNPLWNKAQKQMVETGKMHGYLRMYWCKKILEWSKTPKDAFKIALYLNDKYSLDGRDPNGYAGIAWCFGKHDRPWFRRPVFGMVRYMGEKVNRSKLSSKAKS